MIFLKKTHFYAVVITIMAEKNKSLDGHIKPFGFLKQQAQNVTPGPNVYVKADGTKVTEKDDEYGKSVIEVCTDGTVIGHFYDTKGVLRQDYIRKLNVELVHHFDELGIMTDELMNVYDENNKLAKQTEKAYEYYDNGIKSLEEILESPSDIKTTNKYNQKGERTEKIVQRGTVKTWYNADDKPVKREIDRGAGGIITENL